MKEFRITIIGCGKVGKTFGYLLSRVASVRIKNLIDISIDQSIATQKFIGYGSARSDYKELAGSDLFLITTEDKSIVSACDSLIKSDVLKAGDVIIHFSGSLDSCILLEAKKVGCFIGSIHPSSTFANPEISVKNFRGTFCCFEGENEAYSRLKPLIEDIGGMLLQIESKDKVMYHLASVFASNYLVVLFSTAKKLFIKAGFDNKIALELVKNLMLKAIENSVNEPIETWKALTGPICRNDVEIIKKHISVMQNDSNLSNLYGVMGSSLLAMLPNNTFCKDDINKLLDIAIRKLT